MSITDFAILTVVVGICIAIGILIRKHGTCTGCSKASQCGGSCCPVAERTVEDMEKRLEDLDQ